MNKLSKQSIYIIAFLNLAAVLYFWWQGSSFDFLAGGGATWLALGRLFGLLLAFAIMAQFLLMGRAPWLERTFGLDKLSRFHHYVGLGTLAFLLAHPLFVTLGTAALTGQGYFEQSLNILSTSSYFAAALLAHWLFIIVVFLSISIVRRRWRYEAWYFIHLLVYLAVLLAIPHQFTFGTDLLSSRIFTAYWATLYILVGLNHLIIRFGRPAYNFHRFRFRVDRVVRESHDVVSIYIKGRDLDKFKVMPGQFMIFRFLDKKRWFEAHPFSLSNCCEYNELRISVKASGDFTAKLPEVKPGTMLGIDGPFGVFTDREEANKILLIAGGIGITPLRSLFEQMSRQGKDVVLLNSNTGENDLVFWQELKQFKNKVINVFTGKEGRLDQHKLRQLVPDLSERLAYVCGPQAMIKSVRADLLQLGLKSDRIKYEKFSL